MASESPLSNLSATVHEQLSIEHKQWLDASANTATSLAKLGEALTAAKSKSTKPNALAPKGAPD
jgi:hypothetical protein